MTATANQTRTAAQDAAFVAAFGHTFAEHQARAAAELAARAARGNTSKRRHEAYPQAGWRDLHPSR